MATGGTGTGAGARPGKALQKQQSFREYVSENDANGDGQLNFQEFCNMVRQREPDVEHSDGSLQQRFDELDTDGDGTVTVAEVMRSSLIDALDKLKTCATDLFRSWDDDKSGTIS